MSREDTTFSLKLCSMFCCVVVVIVVSPFLSQFIRVHYEFSHFNFSRIICQNGNDIISGVNENCTNTLKEALYGYETYYSRILIHSNVEGIPINFDAREKWSECPSINHIRDQGACGSCWAVAVASTIEDRLCIHSKGKVKMRISEEDLLTCCSECGSGCDGGNPLEAWKYWKNNGVVSGGDYGSLNGCKPYSITPCIHFNKMNCSHYQWTPSCTKSCIDSYSKTYEDDLYFGELIYSICADEKQIMKEIMMNGPVQAQIALYNDFMNYKSGVYVPSYGVNFVSQHSLKIIGWGTDALSGVDYWLMANSFNADWGEGGFLRIKRSNTCNAQSNVYAGIPKLDNYPNKFLTNVTRSKIVTSVLFNFERSLHSSLEFVP